MRFLKTPGEKCLWITVHGHNRGRAAWGSPAANGSLAWSSFGPVPCGRQGRRTPGLWRIYPGTPIRESRKVSRSVHVSGATLPTHCPPRQSWEQLLTSHGVQRPPPSPQSHFLPLTAHCQPDLPRSPQRLLNLSWPPGLGTYRLHNLAGLPLALPSLMPWLQSPAQRTLPWQPLSIIISNPTTASPIISPICLKTAPFLPSGSVLFTNVCL